MVEAPSAPDAAPQRKSRFQLPKINLEGVAERFAPLAKLGGSGTAGPSPVQRAESDSKVTS